MRKVHITYFVHGTTTDNENGIATGWNPGQLSARGIEQSRKLRDAIKGRKFDAVICSDLKRAVDSAKLAFPHRKIVKDRRLRECSYGKLNGVAEELVKKDMFAPIDKPFPKGECYEDVEKRIRSLLDDMLRKYPSKHVAFVAHRAPQLALDVILKGKTWKQAIREDWRRTGKWQPGWNYLAEGL